ncbi:MAG: helix-turn-helix domain-containing protein [Planctomycetota bacterium]
MNEREQNILNAAVRVFSRYGVKRTTMADLAAEAGISRQTLYKSFRNKDEVLRTHIRVFAANAVQKVEAGIATTKDLGSQLDLIFQETTIAGYDMMHSSPNSQELLEGMNIATREELERVAVRFQRVIKKAFAPHAPALKESGLTPTSLSDFVQRSARAAKGNAKNRKHLLQQLSTLKQLCLEAAKS